MISLSQPLPDFRPISPAARDWPQWAEDAERRIARASVRDFSDAGCGPDTDPSDAGWELICLWDLDHRPADIREHLRDLAADRFRAIEAAVYAALDAV